MPGYRRFIAYFYEYIDGKRQRNAGFVKAERRNEIWRVTLQLKAARWFGNSMKIYGYFQETDRYETIFLGNGYPQGGSMIQQLRLPTQMGKGSGKGFGNLNGMWIPCGANRCFISSWDENPVDTGRLAEAAEQDGQMELSQEKTEESGNRSTEPEKTVEEIAQEETVQNKPVQEETVQNKPGDAKLNQEKPGEVEKPEAAVIEATECDGGGAEEGETTVQEKTVSSSSAEAAAPERSFPLETAWCALQKRCQRLPVWEQEGWECIRISWDPSRENRSRTIPDPTNGNFIR